MSDTTLVANKKKSFFIVRTGNIAEKEAEWKKLCGDIKPMIDYAASSQPELINALMRSGCSFFYNEKIYYDQVASLVDVSDIPVCDYSANLCENYITSLRDANIRCVVADSADDIETYHDVDPELHVCVRLSLTGDIYDAGCTLEDAPALFKNANRHNILVSSICVDCTDAEEVIPALELMQKAKKIALENGIEITVFRFLGEGVQKLMKAQDDTSMASLREASVSVTIFADGSRFFTENAYVIYAQIIGKKVKKADNYKRILYYTDNGVYCSFYNAHINNEEIKPIAVPVVSHPTDELYDTTIFGPTCDSIDCLGNDFRLPELEIGDWLKYEHVGYQCSNYSTRFNGFEDPDVVVE